MIDNLTISFEQESLGYSIKVPTEDENLPYNLAEAFKDIIERSNANAKIVIEQLIEEFGYSPLNSK